MANILLLDLDYGTVDQFRRIQANQKHEVTSGASGDVALSESDAHIIFCGGDHSAYAVWIRTLREARPDLPVVVVTRLPEVDKWLDALDAGAADYIGAPFEQGQIRRIVDTVLSQPTPPARATPEGARVYDPVCPTLMY